VVAGGRLLGVLLFLFVPLDPGHKVLEIGRGELPSERPNGCVVAVLEGDEPVLHLVKVGEVVWGDDLALHVLGGVENEDEGGAQDGDEIGLPILTVQVC
jgi:hypothetical protein